MTANPSEGPFARLDALSTSALLAAYGAIHDELRKRKIVRSANSPVSDYVELLFCNAFNWTRENGSTAGYDAKDAENKRYQIKGRRLTRHRHSSRQLSAIRNLDSSPFDFLAGALVDDDFKIIRAIILPVYVILAKSTFVKHTNSHKFHLRDDVWALPEARDVTVELQEAAERLNLPV